MDFHVLSTDSIKEIVFIFVQQSKIKQQNIMKPMTVVYDQSLGKYYKINKNTGEAFPVEKNGQEVKKFKVQYTGRDYRMRKEREESLSPPAITNPPFKVKYPLRKNIQNEEKPLRKSVSQTRNKVPSFDFAKSERLRNFATVNSLAGSKVSSFHLPQIQNKLVEYCHIRDNKVNQNNSPLKNVEGSKSISTLLNSYDQKIMNSLEQSLKKRKKSGMNRNMESLPGNLSPKRQFLKEKQIFLKYNPKFNVQTDERQEKDLKERKINLKILERLSLEKNEKATANVYE